MGKNKAGTTLLFLDRVVREGLTEQSLMKLCRCQRKNVPDVQRPCGGSQFRAGLCLDGVQVLMNYKQHCSEYILVSYMLLGFKEGAV